MERQQPNRGAIPKTTSAASKAVKSTAVQTEDKATQAYAWWDMKSKATQTGMDLHYNPDPLPALRTITPGRYFPATSGHYAAGRGTQIRAPRRDQRIQTARYLEWPACLFLRKSPPASSSATIIAASNTSTVQTTNPPGDAPAAAGVAMQQQAVSQTPGTSGGNPAPPLKTGYIHNSTELLPYERRALPIMSKIRVMQSNERAAHIEWHSDDDDDNEEGKDFIVDIPDLNPRDPLNLSQNDEDNDTVQPE